MHHSKAWNYHGRPLGDVAKQGFPIEDYYTSWEDIEYTARLIRSNYGVFVPGSRVYHLSHGVPSPRSDRHYFEIRNRFWMLRFSNAWHPLEKPFWMYHILRWVALYLAQNRLSAASRALVIRALRDGLQGQPDMVEVEVETPSAFWKTRQSVG